MEKTGKCISKAKNIYFVLHVLLPGPTEWVTDWKNTSNIIKFVIETSFITQRKVYNCHFKRYEAIITKDTSDWVTNGQSLN